MRQAVTMDVGLQMQEENGEYVRLGYLDEPEFDEFGRLLPAKKSNSCSIWWWTKSILVCLGLLALGAVFMNWGLPFLVGKEARVKACGSMAAAWSQQGANGPPTWGFMEEHYGCTVANRATSTTSPTDMAPI